MRGPITIILILLGLFPATVLAETTNHLLHSDPGSNSRIIAVGFITRGDSPAKQYRRFGNEGGRIDMEAGVVTGSAEDGTKVLVPLTEVTKVTVHFNWEDREREYDLRVDALLAGSNWPPPGRIRKVVLTTGMTIDFDLVGPGVDRDDRTLFWSCEDENSTIIPFEAIALVQIRSNSFITDANELARYGVVVEVELMSGETIFAKGRSGMFDQTAGVIRYNGESVSLAEVSRVKVGDCRGLKDEKPPVVAEENSAVSLKEGKEAFDFENLDLVDERVKLRETGRKGGWVEGRVVTQDTLTLEILLEEGTLVVPLEKIEKLKVSQGNGGNEEKGALIGGSLVGAAGLALGIAMASDDFFDTSGGDVMAATFLGFGVGAVIGGAIGTAIRTEKWDEIDKMDFSLAISPDNNVTFALTMKF